MPLYGYECQVCQGRFEKVLPIEARFTPTHCGEQARLLMFPSRIISVEPVYVLQEHPDGSMTGVGKITNAPRNQPPTPRRENLVEV